MSPTRFEQILSRCPALPPTPGSPLDLQQSISCRVYQLMVEEHLSISMLAERMGVRRDVIYTRFNNLTYWNLWDLYLIAREFDRGLTDFLPPPRV